MTPAELEELVAAMQGRRVLCVGDLILDRFIYGRATRVSREAPVVALAETRREAMLGACGNVARNVAALGGRAILAAAVGDDLEGHEVSGLLESGGFEDVEIITVPGRATPVKSRYVAGGQQILCADRDPETPLDGAGEARLIEAVAGAVADADVAILSDYGRGAVTPAMSAALIAAANAAGVKVIVDPRGRDFSRYDGAYIIKPNAYELSLEAARPCDDDAQAIAALKAVMGKLNSTEHLLVTRSAKGMALLKRGGAPEFFRSEPRDVYDVSGAGDTTIAALGLAVAAGAGPAQAVKLANQAAGIVVGKVGTAVVRAAELLADAQSKTIVGAPVAAREEAADRVARWKADGLRVGFTNGCFDILHVGHLSTLNRARALCDRLVVGVNADAAVARLKGEGRPIHAAEDRARLLASLAPVDLAVIFEEETASAVITALKPDVYVKGGDYNLETLPEAAAVQAYGGEIAFAPMAEGKSTSGILGKLAAE